MSGDLWERLGMALERRAYAERGFGCSAMTVTLILDRGVLEGWTEPEVTHMEPHGQGRQLLARLKIVMGEERVPDADGLEQLEEDE